MDESSEGTRGKIAVAQNKPVATKVRAKTLRLEPSYERGLDILKGVLGKPINKMVNEAVGEYIDKRLAETTARMAGTLAQLQAYRRVDPGFQRDLEAFVASEAAHGRADPMEGVVDAAPPAAEAAGKRLGKSRAKAGKPAKAEKAGPALNLVRDLLRG